MPESSPLELWRKKLLHLERQLAIASPEQTFSIRELILECRENIARLEEEEARIAIMSPMAKTGLGSPPSPISPRLTVLSDPADSPHVLMLSADPRNFTFARLESEAQLVSLELAQDLSEPHLMVKPVQTDLDNLTRTLVQHRPKVLHFSGHGEEGYLSMADSQGLIHRVAPESLSVAVEVAGTTPECVVFNACQSLEQAEAFLPHTQAVVVMNRDITESAARAFSTGFYRGLSTGASYMRAFEFGVAQIGLVEPSARDIPRLIHGQIPGATEAITRTSESPQGFLYPVWFGTNRAPKDASNLHAGFTTTDARQLITGTAKVFVPHCHRIGEVGSGWWRRLITRRDDRLKLDTSTLQQLSGELFWNDLKAALTTWKADHPNHTGSTQILVYLHGYRVSFEDAALRAAQLGCDLALPGPTAFYSWPSRGTLFGYGADEDAVQGCEPHLTAFLEGLLTQVPDATINLIVHSMGNRAILRVAQQMAQHLGPRKFGEILLCAPDVSRNTFLNQVAHLNQIAEHTSIYVSKRDLALFASRLLHDHDRAGYYEPVTVAPGFDTIAAGDVSLDLLGHGYYADARPVLADFNKVLCHRVPVNTTRGLRQRTTPDGTPYWLIPA